MTWFEAAQFCNYLTSGDKSLGAYLFSGDNSNAGDFLGIDRASALSVYGIAYVIPTEDEWYKAAYYTGSGYSAYANGLDTIPAADVGWNYHGGTYTVPWNVGTGTEEQNGTFDMMGNLAEWNEALLSGLYGYNYHIGRRGGYCGDSAYTLSSSCREWVPAYEESVGTSFRIAEVQIVPLPGAALLSVLGLGAATRRLRRMRAA